MTWISSYLSIWGLRGLQLFALIKKFFFNTIVFKPNKRNTSNKFYQQRKVSPKCSWENQPKGKKYYTKKIRINRICVLIKEKLPKYRKRLSKIDAEWNLKRNETKRNTWRNIGTKYRKSVDFSCLTLNTHVSIMDRKKNYVP